MSNLHNYELISINSSLLKHTAYQCVSLAPLSPLHFSNESSLPIHYSFDHLHIPTCTILVPNHSTIPSKISANDYFQKRNAQVIEEVQEYSFLTQHIKKENVIMKTKVASLQNLVDDMTGSNQSLRRQLKKKEKELEEIMNTKPKLVPTSPQV